MATTNVPQSDCCHNVVKQVKSSTTDGQTQPVFGWKTPNRPAPAVIASLSHHTVQDDRRPTNAETVTATPAALWFCPPDPGVITDGAGFCAVCSGAAHRRTPPRSTWFGEVVVSATGRKVVGRDSRASDQPTCCPFAHASRSESGGHCPHCSAPPSLSSAIVSSGPPKQRLQPFSVRKRCPSPAGAWHLQHRSARVRALPRSSGAKLHQHGRPGTEHV